MVGRQVVLNKVGKVGKEGQRPHPLLGRRVVLKPGRGRRRVGRRWRRRGAAALRGKKTGGKEMFKRREARQKNYQESRSAKIQLVFPPEKGDVNEDEAMTTKNNIVNETPGEEEVDVLQAGEEEDKEVKGQNFEKMATLEKNTVVSKAEKTMGNTAEWATSRNDINSNTDAVFPWVLPEIDGGEPIKLEAVDVEVVDDEREMVEEVEKEKLEQAENGDGERRVEAEDGFLKEIATDDDLSKVHSSKSSEATSCEPACTPPPQKEAPFIEENLSGRSFVEDSKEGIHSGEKNNSKQETMMGSTFEAEPLNDHFGDLDLASSTAIESQENECGGDCRNGAHQVGFPEEQDTSECPKGMVIDVWGYCRWVHAFFLQLLHCN